MKKRLNLLTAIAVTATGLSLFRPAAEASIEQELTHKAHKIEDIARELKIEFRKHYLHLSTFRHLMSDLDQLRAEVEHIDRLAHNPRGQMAHLQADVKDLDRIAHHLHEVVDASERCAPGHVHGNTGHVHELLTVLNNTIHRLEFTVASIRGQACATPSRNQHRPAHFARQAPRKQVAHVNKRSRSFHGHRH